MEADACVGPSGLHSVVSDVMRSAGNGHSTNGSSGSLTPKQPRKRLRRQDSWKRNVTKAKRAKGNPYVSPSNGSRLGKVNWKDMSV